MHNNYLITEIELKQKIRRPLNQNL